MPDVLQLYPVCLRGSSVQAFPARREEASPRLLKPTDWETSFVLVCDRCSGLFSLCGDCSDSSCKKEAGEAAQWLRALTVLPKGLGLDSQSPQGGSHCLTPALEDPDPLRQSTHADENN